MTVRAASSCTPGAVSRPARPDACTWPVYAYFSTDTPGIARCLLLGAAGSASLAVDDDASGVLAGHQVRVPLVDLVQGVPRRHQFVEVQRPRLVEVEHLDDVALRVAGAE